MKCPNRNCNADNPANAKFCNQCGAKLLSKKKCPYPDCGTEGLPLVARFCPDCGRSLENPGFKEAEAEIGLEEIIAESTPSPNTPSNKLVEMVKVDGGSFKMGGTNYGDEKPMHTVSLDTFFIGKCPVTQREWKALMGTNPSCFQGDDCPVERVSWYDAVNFCNKLSKREGYDECYRISGNDVSLIANAVGYRLPTEAEWEYAARGGNKSRGYTYAGSNNLGDVGWYNGNSGSRTHTVNQKSPNELGLYDMSGNVWEWCWDWKDDNYYACSPNRNPTGPASGSYRVYRGGGWYCPAGGCAVSDRSSNTPVISYSHLGFRLAFACSSK